MNQGIIFVLIAGVASGLYQVMNKLIPQTVNSYLGAVLLSLSAVIFGLIVLSQNIGKAQLVSGYQGIVFAILAGVCVFFINFLAQSAYKGGLPISTGGPTIISVSLIIVAIAGIIMGEKMSFFKILGLVLIAIGSFIVVR